MPLAVVTVTSTAPRPFGATAVMNVEDLTTNLADADPKCTALAPDRLLPVIATEVPPDADPDGGLTVVTSGSVVGPTTSRVLAVRSEPRFGCAPLPSKGVTLAWLTVKVWLPGAARRAA